MEENGVVAVVVVAVVVAVGVVVTMRIEQSQLRLDILVFDGPDSAVRTSAVLTLLSDGMVVGWHLIANVNQKHVAILIRFTIL